MKNKNVKYYIGFGFFVFACSPPLLVPVLPFIGMDRLVWFLPALFVTSKTAMIISVYILGKPVVAALKVKLKNFILRRKENRVTGEA